MRKKEMKHKRESIHEKRYLYRDKTGQEDRSEEAEEGAEQRRLKKRRLKKRRQKKRRLKKRRLKKRRLKMRYHMHERNSDKRKIKVKN